MDRCEGRPAVIPRRSLIPPPVIAIRPLGGTGAAVADDVERPAMPAD